MAKTKVKGTRGKASKKAGTVRASTKKKTRNTTAKTKAKGMLPVARRGLATAKAQLKRIKRKVERAF